MPAWRSELGEEQSESLHYNASVQSCKLARDFARLPICLGCARLVGLAGQTQLRLQSLLQSIPGTTVPGRGEVKELVSLPRQPGDRHGAAEAERGRVPSRSHAGQGEGE